MRKQYEVNGFLENCVTLVRALLMQRTAQSEMQMTTSRVVEPTFASKRGEGFIHLE